MDVVLQDGVIPVLALMFGGIAVWGGIYLAKRSNKPAPKLRPPARAEAPSESSDMKRLRHVGTSRSNPKYRRVRVKMRARRSA